MKIFTRNVHLDKEGTKNYWTSSGSGSGARNFLKEFVALQHECFVGSGGLAEVCALHVLLLQLLSLLLFSADFVFIVHHYHYSLTLAQLQQLYHNGNLTHWLNQCITASVKLLVIKPS